MPSRPFSRQGSLESFVPKLWTTLRGYTREDLVADLGAGVIVGIVALPLAIAFAIASGVTPERGLYTAIVAGFIVSALGGSRVQIGGPTGAFVVIVYAIVQKHGVDGLAAATLMAGVLLMLFGFARLGGAIKFIPYPVTIGFTAGSPPALFSVPGEGLPGRPLGPRPPRRAVGPAPRLVRRRVHHRAARGDRVAAFGGGVGRDDRRPSSLEHGARGAGSGEHRLTDLRWHPRDRGDRAHSYECEERRSHAGGGDRARLHAAAHHAVLRPLGGPHSHGDARRDPRGRGLPHERVAYLPVRTAGTQERRRRAARNLPLDRARGPDGRDRGRDGARGIPVHAPHGRGDEHQRAHARVPGSRRRLRERPQRGAPARRARGGRGIRDQRAVLLWGGGDVQGPAGADRREAQGPDPADAPRPGDRLDGAARAARPRRTEPQGRVAGHPVGCARPAGRGTRALGLPRRDRRGERHRPHRRRAEPGARPPRPAGRPAAGVRDADGGARDAAGRGAGLAKMSGGPELIVAKGTCYPLFAYEVAQPIGPDAAERRLLAAATERLSVKQKRRAPAYFEYRPAPLRVTQEAESLGLAAYHTAPSVELVLYDFGAISVSYAVPIAWPLAGLAALSAELWGNDRLVAESRRHVERVLGTLGDAAVRPRIADFVEDYSIFQVEAFTTPCEAAALWTHHAQTVAQILRAEPRSLSQQEINDATASRLSFGLDDATFIDTDATLLFDPEADDVRAVIEFANTQLLEMRFLDQQLDDALERAYETLMRRRARLFGLGQYRPELRRLARLQLDGAILFEQVTNALKLVGEQYLARVYSLASRRFHLAEWDASITRKLQTIDSIYAKMADRAASRRMELLEWIIIVLIALSIIVSLGPVLGAR